jgi:hypothetical protein
MTKIRPTFSGAGWLMYLKDKLSNHLVAIDHCKSLAAPPLHQG